MLSYYLAKRIHWKKCNIKHYDILCDSKVSWYMKIINSLRKQLTLLIYQEDQMMPFIFRKITSTKTRIFLNFSDEIAGCIEKAYEQIQFSEATRVLFFSTPKKMTDYAKKVCIFSFGNQSLKLQVDTLNIPLDMFIHNLF